MATLDIIMTGFTGTEEIKKMTERSIQSLWDSEGSENFNIIFLESNLDSDHKYNVSHQVHPEFPYHCNKYYNIGITYAKSDFTAIVNNDTFFHKNWWTKLHTAMIKHSLDCASPRSPVEQFGLVPRAEMKHRFTPINKVVEGYEAAVTFCGWCWVIKREVREWLFPVDEQFSFYYNDNDVAMHLKERGCKHALVAASMVEHYGQRSHKALHDRNEYYKHTFALEKNFTEKWKHLFS
jgi:GT2 family glycosyltransferase